VGIALEDVPMPETSPYEVLIKVKAVGICGSDLRIFNAADPKRRKKYILGHELAGEVVGWGELIHRFKERDRVATEICIGCAICRYCKKGLINLCENINELGITMHGGMAEYVAVPARNVHRLSEDISYEEATFADPLACSIRGLELANIEPRSWVAVLGPGPIGLLATQVAKRILRANVIVTGTNEARLEIARQFGADYAFNIRAEDPTEEILDITDGGVDYSFEAAGKAEALQQAIYITRKNGAIVVMTVHKEIQVDMEPIIRNELTVYGSICYNYREYDHALDLLAKKKIDLKPLLGNTYPLSQASEAFEFAFSREAIKVILTP
jgi:threonine dehydrogenase-like Zn-dependent dehydrogenase